VAVRKLAVGLPVYNGQNYLEESLEAVLSQTFTDFTVTIADNASTDDTPRIIEAAAQRDPRISILRQTHNLGAAPNFNAAYRASPPSDYYVWVAHDDLPQPRFFEECVRTLDERPDAVLAFSTTAKIDASGAIIEHFPNRYLLQSEDRATRLINSLSHTSNHPIFGVMRRSALDKTRLHGSYTGSDRTLLAEMALLGPFVEVQDVLFHLREHPGRSVRVARGRDHHAREAWFDTSRAGKLAFPRWHRLGEVVSAVGRTPMPVSDRLRCYGGLGRSVVAGDWKPLVLDVVVASRQIASRARRVTTTSAK
jgi:glycosyltransferase involved in cell wall biosynthesis